jgi:3-oxoacyl-[acyl-carrier protein] reductase
MDLRLKGKKAVVTGGTRGIGRAIAETLAQEGCDVAICARHAEGVQEAVEALKAKGVNATGGVVDVADGEALKAWVKKAGEELGGIDILVSNPSGWGGTSDEAWARSFNVDLMGAVRSVEAAKPFLQKAAAAEGDAAIVIISSVSAAVARDPSSYGPIKAALIHLAKGLAKEGAPKHIRVNTISPGTVYFEGGVWHRREQNDPDMFKAVLAANPTGRMATPQDIANAAAFLASPVSSFTTGINLIVDGAITDRVNF